MNCKVCSENVDQLFKNKVLQKYDVQYYFCRSCGFIFTEQPYWLDEAYTDSITSSDTGIIERNLKLSSQLSILIYFYFNKDARFLDLAGGYGILTRLMRDNGFDYYWDDKYSKNMVARGFENETSSKQEYQLLSAFEILEHLENPIKFILSNLEKYNSEGLIFSTCLYAGKPPDKSWWYYAFDEGQHIAFFRRGTFEFIANKLNLYFTSINGIHILSKKKITISRFKKYLLGNNLCRLTNLYLRKKIPSLVMADHDKIIKLNKN